MKLHLTLLITVVALGCASPQLPTNGLVDELKATEIYGFGFLRDPSCTCPFAVDEYLSDLTRETNAILEPKRQVHFLFVYDYVQTNTNEMAKNPFPGNSPCPVHSALNPLTSETGETYMSAWTRLQIIVELGRLDVEVAPKSRTVILYKNARDR